MPQTQRAPRRVDLNAQASRVALAKMIMKLFTLWNLNTNDQLELLGLSPKSRALLSRYRGGSPLPEGRDVMDRVGLLLAVHKALGLLYPHNEGIRYSWVSIRNQHFDNLTPLEVMKEQGIVGLSKVSRCLDFLRGV